MGKDETNSWDGVGSDVSDGCKGKGATDFCGGREAASHHCYRMIISGELQEIIELRCCTSSANG
jgi:hypothetical protein